MRTPMVCILFVSFFIILNCYSTTSQQPSQSHYPTTANLSTTWTNNDSLPYTGYSPVNGETNVRAILLRNLSGPSFMCGFFCNGNCTSYLFSVFISETGSSDVPQVVWSANRDRPVRDGAELSLTAAAGELVLRDVDGSTVWSTNTSGKSVAGLNLTRDGNLVLFDTRKSIVWQSFDYPTDCLVWGQRLFEGQQLVPSVSDTNWTSLYGSYSVRVTHSEMFGSFGSDQPLVYGSIWGDTANSDTYKGRSYVKFFNGGLSLFFTSAEPSDPIGVLQLPEASSIQYIKLMSDGRLLVFEWKQDRWSMVDDLLTYYREQCGYPLACGRNSFCSAKQQCSCPSPEYFRPVNDRQPKMGCSEITPLKCNATQDQEFISLKNVLYFEMAADMKKVNIETCKQACVNNCSCKVALFQHDSESANGDCFLLLELFTLSLDPPDESFSNVSAFIKVQKSRLDDLDPSSTPILIPDPLSKPNHTSFSTTRIVLISTCASVALVLGVISFSIYVICKRRRQRAAEMEEESFEMEEESIRNIQGMPTRFAYGKLQTATENFNKKLGEGGFGAVFEGILEDGSKIAVKCLDGVGQVKKSFLAEVESIGSIHHVNLVRLRGFCAWKSQRFLVYEFMCNGSLDRWIYHGVRERVLDWECRKKIILDVAKGLAYLHEDCRQKIIHLDIKPQNILLDIDFNAKVADFGLAKLIDRNQSEVEITLRGTPGYLAPEWLSSVVNEKVDVYSFGVVLLETLCGRKKFDKSLPEHSWHLLVVFQKCLEQGTLPNLVDEYSADMQIHTSDVVEMMKVAAWCLQYEFTKRPSMSTVVKVLEGMIKVESNLSYNFTSPEPYEDTTLLQVEQYKNMTPLQASILSGPRNI